MPAASAAGSFCLIANSDMPKREFSTLSEISKRDHQQAQRQHDIDARIVELHVEQRRFPLHRQGSSW